MDLIIFERKAFEEFAAKIEQFILQVSNSPTLRDIGTLAYTKIGNRTYYLPEDVENIITKVEDRRKEARWKGREI